MRVSRSGRSGYALGFGQDASESKGISEDLDLDACPLSHFRWDSAQQGAYLCGAQTQHVTQTAHCLSSIGAHPKNNESP
jgi:hypothetical protein